jgi:hypothetical protein
MIGVAFQAIATLFVVYMAAFFTAVRSGWQDLTPDWMAPWGMGHWMSGRPFTNHPILGFIWVILALVVIGLGAYGALLMNSSRIGKVRTGSTLVLIVSLIAFPTMWGFMIGSLLMFIGSLLGLTWLPPQSSQSPQTV